MLKSIFALFLILLLSSNSYSLVENEVVVYGQIYKYDNEFVFLKNGKKKIGIAYRKHVTDKQLKSSKTIAIKMSKYQLAKLKRYM